jgi:PiT family inorganic phosphate transporter
MVSAQVGLWVVILLVVLALIFDFMNGFHDAANSIATVVSTGVLKPGQAVLFAAIFNFVAIFVFQLTVAATIGKGLAQPGVVDVHVVFGALVGAISWNFITWYYGIPSSSSHALIGGIVGAVISKAGASALVFASVMKTVVFIFVAPLLGFVLGSVMLIAVAWTFRRATPSRVDRWFRRLQLVSAGAYSLGHGGNDAQKTIGIVWMLLIATGYSAVGDKDATKLGSVELLFSHCPGYAVWGLAHCQNHGSAADQAETSPRVLCRNRWRHDAVHGCHSGYSRIDHAHHHGRDCGGGGNPARQCGSLGGSR